MKSLNINLTLEFVKRDFVERFAGSIFGSVWSFILPLVNIMIYTIIFSNIMNARLAQNASSFSYSVYLISALLPWTAFSTTIMRSTTIFIDKKNIISKINVTLPSMPLYINLSETVTLFISVTFYLGFLMIIGHGLSVYILMIPFIFMLQQLLAYAIGLILAVLTVFIRDLKEVVGIVLQVWFWFTPIVYVKEILPQWVQKVIVYNPVFILSDSFQNIFLRAKLPDMQLLNNLTVVTFILLFLSYLIYIKLESDVKDFL